MKKDDYYCEEIHSFVYDSCKNGGFFSLYVNECCVRTHSGALLTVGEGSRKGHTKSASISAAGTRHSDLPPLDTNLDNTLRSRYV